MGQAIKFGALGGGFTLGGGVRSMFYDTIDKKLYVSGQFQKADNNYVWGVAVWDGIKWDSLQGGFTQFPHQSANPSQWSEFAHKIVRFQNRLYFIGGIIWVNGKNQYHMGVWDITTSSWVYPIAQPPNDAIYDLKVHNNTLYACGLFTKFGNTTCNYVAKFDGVSWQPVGDITNYFGNYVPAQVTSVEVYNNEVYLGGYWLDASLTTSRNIAKFNGNNWENVGTGIRQGGVNGVWCLQEFNNKLYIGGRFDKTVEIPGRCIVAWNGNTYEEVNPNGIQNGGYISFFKKHQNKLFVTGGFLSYDFLPAYNIFYIDTLKQCSINGLESTFTNSTATSGFSCCELINDSLIVGGGIQYLDTVLVNKIGVITNFENNSSCLFTGITENFFENNPLKIYPNPTKDKLNIEFEVAETTKIKLEVLTLLGQSVYVQNELNHKQEIDISSLPEGIYFLKLQRDSEQRVFKVVKD
jgi:hypothetical protein